MNKFSVMLLAIAVVIEVACLARAEPYADLLPVSIETTELWYNPWPAPGDRTAVADEKCRIPSGACAPADDSRASVSNGARAAF